MDADEARRVELLLHLGHRLLLQQFLALDDVRHVVILSLDVVDLVDGNDVDVGTGADENAVGPVTGRLHIGEQVLCGNFCATTDPGAGLPERFGKSLGTEGLQQVVDRVDLERLQGELVVRGDEDHVDVLPQKLENFEAVELRHLDVEKDEIR